MSIKSSDELLTVGALRRELRRELDSHTERLRHELRDELRGVTQDESRRLPGLSSGGASGSGSRPKPRFVAAQDSTDNVVAEEPEIAAGHVWSSGSNASREASWVDALDSGAGTLIRHMRTAAVAKWEAEEDEARNGVGVVSPVVTMRSVSKRVRSVFRNPVARSASNTTMAAVIPVVSKSDVGSDRSEDGSPNGQFVKQPSVHTVKTDARSVLDHFALGDGDAGEMMCDRVSQYTRRIHSDDEFTLRDFLVSIVYSSYFEYFFLGLVLINAVLVGVQIDYMAKHLQVQPPRFFVVIEIILCCFFTSEVACRLAVDRNRFFKGPGWRLNVLDTVIIVLQLVETFFSFVVQVFSLYTLNLYTLRIVRMIRLSRIVRTLRLLRLIGEVRSIVWSVAASMKPLIGASLILFFLIYMTAVYLTEVATLHRARAEPGDECFSVLGRYYGSLSRSILSLFQSISGGVDWEVTVDPLVTHISPMLGVGFAFFIAFCLLALMNVVTGVFVESALRQGKADKDSYTVSYLKRLFGDMDTNDSGMITLQDFKQHLQTKDMRELFRSIDLDVSEADGVFRILDWNNDGIISQDEFLSGCLRLRGTAKALDVLVLMRETDRMFRVCLSEIKVLQEHLLPPGAVAVSKTRTRITSG